MQDKIDKSMFEDWTKNPITKEIMCIITNTAEIVEKEIVKRRISNEEDIYNLIFLKGRLSALLNFLNITFTDLEEYIKENEINAK
jgi:hypothetical protein